MPKTGKLHGAEGASIVYAAKTIETGTESPHAAATPTMARVRKWTAMSLCRGIYRIQITG